VDVHEAREEVQAVGVQLARSAQALADLGDAPEGDADVADAIEASAGVEDAGVTDHQLRRTSEAVAQAATSWAAPVATARTADRTETPAAT
jgi:hypothetical protein